MVTPYVTLLSRTEFSRNKTGFGYMVYDISRAVAKTEDVYLLATDSRGIAFVEENVFFHKRYLSLFIRYFFNCMPFQVVLKLTRSYPEMARGTKLRLLYYWFMTGYVKHILKKGRYDIIHIHGCGFATELWMQICNKCNQKFVVTLHGLNSFSETVKLEHAGKLYERDFLKRVVNDEFPITVISTGMKGLIENTYGVFDCKSITVVCNSVSFVNSRENSVDIRELYGIPKEAKIILYVGNISENKNQIQMVRAFSLLPTDLRYII